MSFICDSRCIQCPICFSLTESCFFPGEAVSREAMAHPSPASDGHRSSRSEEDARRKTTSIHTVRPSPKRRDGPDSHRGNIGQRGVGRTDGEVQYIRRHATMRISAVVDALLARM